MRRVYSIARHRVGASSWYSHRRMATAPPPSRPATVNPRHRAPRPDGLQLQVAQNKMKHMSDIVQNLHRANHADIRRAFLYWLSRPVQALFDRDPINVPNPMEQNTQILEFMMNHYENAPDDSSKILIANQISDILSGTFPGESFNSPLCRLMVQYLKPMQGTRAALDESGRRHIHQSAEENLHSLLAATRVLDRLQYLHESVFFPKFVPDSRYYMTYMNLISKRCKFLRIMGPTPRDLESRYQPRVRRGVQWNSESTRTALGNCLTVSECVTVGRNILRTMQASDNIQPEMMHYSMLIAMLGHASTLEVGFAKEAYELLKSLEQTIDGADMSGLYNNVLLAYYNEVSLLIQRKKMKRAAESQKEFEKVWERRQTNLTDVTDPIPYSILMKLYQYTDQAPRAQQVLDEMITKSAARQAPVPTIMHYNAVLNAWAKSSHPDSGERALSLLRQMEELASRDSKLLRPDQISYTTTIDALLRSAETVDDSLMDRMQAVLGQFERNSNPRHRPDSVTYNILYHTLGKRVEIETMDTNRTEIANRMDSFFRDQLETSSHFRTVAKDRMYRYFNECMRAWSFVQDPMAVDRSFQLLDTMTELYATCDSAKPNGATYAWILSTLSISTSPDTVQTARSVFDRMEQEGCPRTANSVRTYLGMLIRCHFGGTTEYGDQEFVDRIMERFDYEAEDGFSYSWIFEALFNFLDQENDKLRKEMIARRTEKLFRALQQSERFREKEGFRIFLFFNHCLRSWAFSHSRLGADRAMCLLNEMEEDPTCTPDIKSYEFAMSCLSRVSSPESLEKARSLFGRVEEEMGMGISLSFFNTFLHVLVRSGEAASILEAEQIVELAHEDFFAGKSKLCPNYASHEILWSSYLAYDKEMVREADRVLARMEQLAEKTGDKSLEPSEAICFKMMHLWSLTQFPDAIERAEHYFQRMSPNAKAVASLQAAWSRSTREDAPQQVESLLVQLQRDFEKNGKYSPTVSNFEWVIHCWALRGQPDRANAVLERLEALSETTKDLTPTKACYEAALHGWAASSDPDASQKAMAILDRAIARSEVLHDSSCFIHAMVAVVKSKDPEKAQKCYDILQSAREFLVQNGLGSPDHQCFLNVIRACGASQEKEAAHLIVQTMQHYSQTSHPRHDVFMESLKALQKQVRFGKERDHWARAIHEVMTPRIRNDPVIQATLLELASAPNAF